MNKFSKFKADVICEMHPLFKGLLWVSAARSNDESRMVLMNIQIEREGKLCHIVATDGRRLHLHTFDPGMFDDDIDMLEPGQYEVITKNAKLIVIAPSTENFNYPNWRLVVPDYKPQHSAVITSQTTSKLGIATGVLLASDFVSDAIGFKHGVSKDSSVVISFGSEFPKAAFVITHELGKAIVMPLRMDEQVPEEEAKNDVELTAPLPGLERGPIEENSPIGNLVKTLSPGESIEITSNGDGIKIDHDEKKTPIRRGKKSINTINK